jgi:hypothetical protein
VITGDSEVLKLDKHGMISARLHVFTEYYLLITNARHNKNPPYDN